MLPSRSTEWKQVVLHYNVVPYEPLGGAIGPSFYMSDGGEGWNWWQ